MWWSFKPSHQVRVIYAFIAFVAMLIVNVWSYFQSFISINFYNDQAHILFYPDAITYNIWGLVYSFSLAYVVFQALDSSASDINVEDCRPFIAVAMVCNSIWLLVYAYQIWVATMVVVVTYIVALYCAYTRAKAFYYPHINAKEISWLKQSCFFAAISSNSAFVLFGTIGNACLAVQNFGYNPDPQVDSIVTSFLLLGYALVGSALCIYRADFPFFAVSLWSIAGIMRRQMNTSTLYRSDTLVLVGWASVSCLCVSMLYAIVMGVRSRMKAPEDTPNDVSESQTDSHSKYKNDNSAPYAAL